VDDPGELAEGDMAASGPSRQRPLSNKKRLAPILIVALVASGGLVRSWLDRPAQRREEVVGDFPQPRPVSYKNTSRSVAFVGDEVCARCHAEISKSYRGHPMGRSMTTPGAVLPEVDGVVFEVGDLSYAIERRDGRVFHQETRKGGSGGRATKTEAEVRYVIGSGTRGYSFLVEKDHGLFQSPIAWYTQERKWDLPPDYRRNNQHFDRKITAGCLFCHTNRFDQAEGRSTVFHGLTIGCERCHGPGELHARGPEMVDGRDLTIVNPARLEPATLRDNVCEQCHFQGIQRIERSENASFDYRPGLPLEKFLLIMTSRFDPTLRYMAVGHVEQMRSSRCYVASSGELGCISCHDPHRLPDPASRVAYYRQGCLKCHARRGCTLPLAERREKSPGDDCAGCHMPRSAASNVAHTALTDHTIPRRSTVGQ
jgi:hypothetical protein